jgi:hypothetical protein
MSWDFDSKEHAREKYGNINTPVIMKLVSKFNKKNDSVQLNSNTICSQVVEALNNRLKELLAHEEQSQNLALVVEEVERFESMNGFINIFLTNEQFMDRVHVQFRKKVVTNKDAWPTGDLNSSAE